MTYRGGRGESRRFVNRQLVLGKQQEGRGEGGSSLRKLSVEGTLAMSGRAGGPGFLLEPDAAAPHVALSHPPVCQIIQGLLSQ